MIDFNPAPFRFGERLDHINLVENPTIVYVEKRACGAIKRVIERLAIHCEALIAGRINRRWIGTRSRTWSGVTGGGIGGRSGSRVIKALGQPELLRRDGKVRRVDLGLVLLVLCFLVYRIN